LFVLEIVEIEMRIPNRIRIDGSEESSFALEIIEIEIKCLNQSIKVGPFYNEKENKKIENKNKRDLHFELSPRAL
jgi:hypothetical protein